MNHFIIYTLTLTIFVLSSALTVYHWLQGHEWVGMFFIATMSAIMTYCSWGEYE